jgi:DNA polymerase I-like protein with 3'-5' exonuclease and polymerase domains
MLDAEAREKRRQAALAKEEAEAARSGLRRPKYRKQKPAHLGGMQLPVITPDSDWEPPTSLPDLRRVGRVAMDLENRDDGLADSAGSGWATGRGYISGMSCAWDGGSFFVPIRHPDTECMDGEVVQRWMRDHINAGVRFITHHGSHDWGWIGTEWKLSPPVLLDDTEGAAMSVDENRLSYSLDDLCRWRGVPGKDEDALREAAAAYGVHPKSELWKMPARYVAPYAEQDARATLALFDSLHDDLVKEETLDAYRLEMDIMPMVIAMRRRGIRVNLEHTYGAMRQLERVRDETLAELARRLGVPNVTIEQCRQTKVLQTWFSDEGLTLKHFTEKTKKKADDEKVPAFQATWMRKHEHWLPRLVARAEQMEEASHKFLQGFIINYAHNGRIHASINQFRGEEGGTRSHRFSYSDPALQQMHSRPFTFKRDEYDRLTPFEQAQMEWDNEDEVWAARPDLPTVIRGCFEPEEGEFWAAADYSQQEYRLIVHFATLLKCTRAEAAAALYREKPDTDFHKLVSEWTGLERKPAKDTNFAKAFGAGIPKFAEMIGQSFERAKDIMDQYDGEMPFVKELAKTCQSMAERRGYIRLIDGARSHFDMWEPSWREDGEAYRGPMPLAQAREHWGSTRRLKRAFGHKAMNRLIQGSAARQIKMAMRACWREGLLPMLQMHDELDFSVASSAPVKRVIELMRDVVTLQVPMKVDAEIGLNWGDAKHSPEAPETWAQRPDSMRRGPGSQREIDIRRLH